jgi:hypothetical protein
LPVEEGGQTLDHLAAGRGGIEVPDVLDPPELELADHSLLDIFWLNIPDQGDNQGKPLLPTVAEGEDGEFDRDEGGLEGRSAEENHRTMSLVHPTENLFLPGVARSQ